MDTGVQILMYKFRTGNIMGTQSLTTLNTPKGRRNTTAVTPLRVKRTKQEALLIKMKDVSYAELLQTVKRKVNPSEVGAEVKFTNKTRNGELLIRVQSGTEELKNELSKQIPGITATRLTNKKVLHVRDLEEGTTEEEVREAFVKVTAMQPDAIEVRALRPAYGNRQNTTVILEETEAEGIIQRGIIRVGWTQCRVIERKGELKCYRCWAVGHTRVNCRGPDRVKVCLKCGKEGHKVADCKNKPYCVLCKEEGHQTGNRDYRRRNGNGAEKQRGWEATPLFLRGSRKH